MYDSKLKGDFACTQRDYGNVHADEQLPYIVVITIHLLYPTWFQPCY